MLDAWCLMLEHLPDPSTKGGGGRRPPPFVDGSGRCSSIKHQASSIKLLGYEATSPMGSHGSPWVPWVPLASNHRCPWILSAAPAASPKIHGKSMGSHGFPWVPMGSHGTPWDPMGPHGTPWDPMGPHGTPWGPHGVPMGFHGKSKNVRNHGF